MENAPATTEATYQPEAPAQAAPTSAPGSTNAQKPNPGLPNPNGSLYVGDLNAEATEADLHKLFSQCGVVASIRVCRDAITRRSLGYAYVNYHTVADGEKALQMLNFHEIKGRPCRIMWSQRDPNLRKSGANNIFVKNLDKSINTVNLYDTFVQFGNILSAKVATDEHGQSKGYGFIHFAEPEAAAKAIQLVNGMLLKDQKVYVGPHIPKKERLSKLDEIRSHFTNLYVKNIDKSLDLEAFRALFAPFGEITSVALPMDESDPENPKNKGFGFVDFTTHEEAQKAIDELNEKDFDGQKLFVGRAQKKAEREEELRRSFEAAKAEKLSKFHGVNLYVKNIDDDTDEEGLRREFSPYGTITSLTLMRDQEGKSNRFGYVCFSTPEEASKAIAELNGKMVGSKPLYVVLHQRKEQRRQQLENEMATRNIRNIRTAAAAGIPNGYLPAPMFYPPAPGYGPQGGRGPPGGFNGPMIPGGRGGYRGVGPMPGMPMPMMGYPGMPNYPGVPGYPPVPPPDMARNVPGVPPTNRPPPTGADGAPAWKPDSLAGQDPELMDRLLKTQSEDEQKNMIGELIYPVAEGIHPGWAGKVTGMILDTGLEACHKALKDNDLLIKTIREAVDVLVRQRYEAEGGAPPAPGAAIPAA